MQGEASRILKGVASGIPEDWARRPPEAEVSGFPTGWGNCFSPGGGLLFSRKMAAAVRCYIQCRDSSSHSPMPLPQACHSRLSPQLQIMLPSLNLTQGWVSGNTKPVHWHLRTKGRGKK